MLRPLFTALTVLGLGAAIAGPPLVPADLRLVLGNGAIALLAPDPDPDADDPVLPRARVL